MDYTMINKYYLFILKTHNGFHYHLKDEYREITYISRDSSYNGSGFNHTFDYKIEINLKLFLFLKKGSYVFTDLESFISKYKLEEYII